MKRILLLGAGGFIGSHLVAAISKREDYELTAVDIRKDKLDEVVSEIKYLRLDVITEKEKLENLVKENDIIVNMIAIANPGIYVKDPVMTFELDFTENLNIIRMCIKYKKRLIHFSTSEVYGKSPSIYAADKKFYFNEEDSDLILGPVSKHRWIYACSKQLLDRVIHAYGRVGKLNYSIIRPFNYIGPLIDFLPSEEEGFPRVFSFFMDALLYKKPMYLVDGGLQRRCYTYIKDATDAHIRIIDNKDGCCDNQIFNIGTDKNETTIKDLALSMRQVYEEHFMKDGEELPELKEISGREFYGEGYDDSDRRLPDSSKLVRLTGWKPRYDIKTMLYESMKYYADRHSSRLKGYRSGQISGASSIYNEK